MMVKDFAMKFEIKKSMETQQEWYGKRGLSWHITVIVFNEDGILKTLTLVHLFDNAKQDSNCVIGIVDSVLSFIGRNFENPSINLRSDNADCYHSQDLICLLPLFTTKHNVKILSYNFCEPQLGKDICDRKISVLSRTITQYVNNGNNVVNIHQMKEALFSNTKMKYNLVFCYKLDDRFDFKKSISLRGISKYHSIEYVGGKIRFFRYYGIGTGIEKNLRDLIKEDYDQLILKVKNAEIMMNLAH